MKLRNKKTGEIVEVSSCNSSRGKIRIYYEEKDGQIGTSDSYDSLAELNANWEDAPKTDALHASIVILTDAFENHPDKWNDPEAGIKFVEKLKAYKRLRDKGFRFKYLENNSIVFDAGEGIDDQHIDDMNLLFGEEEE